MLLGGEPFEEEIVMWWNFIGRSHEEIVEQREAWNGDGPAFEPPRFGVVADFDGDRLLAPPMPNTRLKARGRSTCCAASGWRPGVDRGWVCKVTAGKIEANVAREPHRCATMASQLHSFVRRSGPRDPRRPLGKAYLDAGSRRPR